jgi:uncharacterized membrane protein
MDSYKTAAILFLLAGLLFNVTALVSNKPFFIAVGCLNCCVGLLYFFISRKKDTKAE